MVQILGAFFEASLLLESVASNTNVNQFVEDFRVGCRLHKTTEKEQMIGSKKIIFINTRRLRKRIS